jgi:hypothetical protein
MAIAPLPQIEELEELESQQHPWPTPYLRLVSDPRDLRVREAAPEEAGLRWHEGREVAEGRQRRSMVRLRRRRITALVAFVAVAVALSLPLRALGTVTISGQPTPGGTPAGLMDGTVYVVQEGDTLASIAHELNPGGDRRALVAVMAKELGSHVVVAGEHVLLP